MLQNLDYRHTMLFYYSNSVLHGPNFWHLKQQVLVSSEDERHGINNEALQPLAKCMTIMTNIAATVAAEEYVNSATDVCNKTTCSNLTLNCQPQQL